MVSWETLLGPDLLYFWLMPVCRLDFTDRVADFPSGDSSAVRSRNAAGKTTLLVLALPGRQGPPQTQSMYAISKRSMHFGGFVDTEKPTLVAAGL